MNAPPCKPNGTREARPHAWHEFERRPGRDPRRRRATESLQSCRCCHELRTVFFYADGTFRVYNEMGRLEEDATPTATNA